MVFIRNLEQIDTNSLKISNLKIFMKNFLNENFNKLKVFKEIMN